MGITMQSALAQKITQLNKLIQKTKDPKMQQQLIKARKGILDKHRAKAKAAAPKRAARPVAKAAPKRAARPVAKAAPKRALRHAAKKPVTKAAPKKAARLAKKPVRLSDKKPALKRPVAKTKAEYLKQHKALHELIKKTKDPKAKATLQSRLNNLKRPERPKARKLTEREYQA